ncbi:hypothetical protein DAPPUDRAFT_119891 [Daphnia pulex]|uniref:Uncharacterized protein n=1 Tax=Daphnia pulex TaxID=6669 RepID=E9HZT0_DAPPU|nr:hypothetical protein DAPPUDRAFT_119891 [Daphnia pulex]|eukprot:EFX62750.1 hypothetical protein DAPPUDRAFT_119891 [Daphnia pulex]
MSISPLRIASSKTLVVQPDFPLRRSSFTFTSQFTRLSRGFDFLFSPPYFRHLTLQETGWVISFERGSLIPNLISFCGQNMNPIAAPEDEGQAREIEEKKDQA